MKSSFERVSRQHAAAGTASGTAPPRDLALWDATPRDAALREEAPRDAASRDPLPFPAHAGLATTPPATPQQRARDLDAQNDPAASLPAIGKLVASLSSLRFHALPFPKTLEDRFETDTAVRRAKRFWLEGLLVIVLYNLLLVADSFASQTVFMHALLIRTCLITPLALGVNIAMLLRPNKYFRESSVAVVACLAGLSNLYLSSSLDPAKSAFAQFGVLAVILFSNTLMRLRFPYAAAATCVMLAGDAVYLRLDQMLDAPQKILGILLVTGSAMATLIANYSASREERLNYLLCLQGDLMVEELRKANHSLRHMAERDTLTGLANRRLFSDRIHEEWERAQHSGRPLSVVLMDIDRFKLINDTYGHPYGDRVLKRISLLIAESLRRKDDLAARYGGEEFILLLPETSQELALVVADRIRTLVETAGLPALESGYRPIEGLGATISCGVAGLIPGQSGTAGFQSMIDAADKALYEAKKTGRNRTCAAA